MLLVTTHKLAIHKRCFHECLVAYHTIFTGSVFLSRTIFLFTFKPQPLQKIMTRFCVVVIFTQINLIYSSFKSGVLFPDTCYFLAHSIMNESMY